MATLSVRWIKAILFVLACGLIPACTPNPQSNASPPTFNGLTSATPLAGSPGDIALAWTPATDFAGGGITYNVSYFLGTLPADSGKETFQFSTSSSTGVTVTGLTSLDPYIFIVQAQDANGSTDGNTVEVQATAP
jgi:hypothetical protein